MSISNIRRDYLGRPLLEEEAGPDPFALFERWFTEACEVDADATAMSLATATRNGRPSVRTVLLKAFATNGFVFYTNYESQKAQEIAENNRVSLLFYWRAHDRQVRIDGAAVKVSDADSDAYFAVRPFESRISARASRQSTTVENRAALDLLFDREAARFTDGRVPRPAWWGGFRVIPDEFEFWQGRAQRLHDRLRYLLLPIGQWRRDRLAP